MPRKKKARQRNQKWCVRYYMVCLLDVMGQREWLDAWKELPASQKQEPEFVEAVQKTVGTIGQVRKVFRTFYEEVEKRYKSIASLPKPLREDYKRVTSARIAILQFSDTLVFYAPVRGSKGEAYALPALHMIAACASTMPALLSCGVPVRGALHIGTGTILAEGDFYGPALAEVYEIESKTAGYPRVVISNELTAFLLAMEKQGGESAVEKINRSNAEQCVSFLCKDRDGHMILDFLGKDTHMQYEAARIDPVAGCGEVDGSKIVHKAYSWVHAEVQRYQQAGNHAVAGKYEKLLNYFKSRIHIWGVDSQEAHHE